MTTGTYSIADLLKVRNVSAKEFGIGTLLATLQASLVAHNARMNEMVSDLAEVTTDAQRRTGGSNALAMAEVDEFGRAATKKAKSGGTVGFPLKLFQTATGWTEKYLLTASPADMAEQTLNQQRAHAVAVVQEIQRAFLRDDNYTWNDFLVDEIDIAVKRFWNADGAVIPEGPNGESFDPDVHTHYIADGSPLVDDYTALIDNVLEHGFGGKIKLNINRAQEATVRGYSGFTAYQDPRLIYVASDVPGAKLDISRLDNRPIGLLGAAEVWVRSWMPESYIFVYDAASPEKPLAFRQRSQTALQGLRLAGKIETFPLSAEYFEAEFGVGVLTRGNGALLYVGAGSWADGA